MKSKEPNQYIIRQCLENPGRFEISKQDSDEAPYPYQTMDMGGAGACYCNKFYYHVYAARRNYVAELYRLGYADGWLSDKQARAIRRATGTCPHEQALLGNLDSMDKLADTFATNADVPEEYLGQAFRRDLHNWAIQTHKTLKVVSCEPSEDLWLEEFGTAYAMFFKAMQGPRKGPLPRWILGKKKIYSKPLLDVMDHIEERLDESCQRLDELFAQALPFIQSMRESLPTLANSDLVSEFHRQSPWTPEIWIEAVRFLLDGTEPNPTTSCSFGELEALCRRDGALTKKFAEGLKTPART